jgi:hypothetical protein
MDLLGTSLMTYNVVSLSYESLDSFEYAEEEFARASYACFTGLLFFTFKALDSFPDKSLNLFSNLLNLGSIPLDASSSSLLEGFF